MFYPVPAAFLPLLSTSTHTSPLQPEIAVVPAIKMDGMFELAWCMCHLGGPAIP